MSTGSLHLNRDIIIANKRQYVKERQSTTPMEAVLALAQMQRRPRYLFDTASAEGRTLVIGQLTRTELYDPVSTALRFVLEGADAVSFFTDHVIYPHDLDDQLMVARGIKDTPVIYQNYVMNEYGVMAARAADASALVLYASLLEERILRRVVSMTQRWKMSTIIQVRNNDELEMANTLSPHAIAFGDNLSRSVEASIMDLARMRRNIPWHTRIMLANCLRSLSEVEAALEARVDAIFVGEEILKSVQQAARLRELISKNPPRP